MDKIIAEQLYGRMYAIRIFESKVEELFAKGEMPGFVHLYLGQEACASGVCAHLTDKDYITSTHRGHGHCIAKGGKFDQMMAELYAKKTGYNKGKGGSMHIASTQIGILGANGINAAGMPLAVGAALSCKFKKNKNVAVSFLGDGSSNQGTFHEAINLAAALEVPCVFVVENNQYGVGTHISEAVKIDHIVDRSCAYGIPGVRTDGQNVLKVYEEAGKLIKAAREDKGPAILELDTWRYKGHFEGEPATYRTKEQEEQWIAKDAIEIGRTEMLKNKFLTEEDIKEIEKRLNKELENAIEFARNSPYPSPEDALTDIYTD